MRTPKQIVIQREMDYRVRQMKKSMARYQDWKSKQVGVLKPSISLGMCCIVVPRERNLEKLLMRCLGP